MKTITLTASGETITFIKTSKDTNGAYTEIICTLPGGKRGPPRHIHPLQDESFGAIEGMLELYAGSTIILLEPGEHFNVIANTAHSFYNPSDTEIKFRATYRPSLDIEYFLVESFDGLNKLPNPTRPSFQMLVDYDYILKQIPGQFEAAGVPTFALTFLLPLVCYSGKPRSKITKKNTTLHSEHSWKFHELLIFNPIRFSAQIIQHESRNDCMPWHSSAGKPH
jgi:quercetin dioxygenase-like cupin family protein